VQCCWTNMPEASATWQKAFGKLWSRIRYGQKTYKNRFNPRPEMADAADLKNCACLDETLLARLRT
jgi:hypothetical protein